jgi:Lrp/AsnC family transcriptional regulator for asnA, asnC and gidA
MADMRETRKIDPIDSKIIHLLQRDGRLSNTEIAKTLDLSEATIRTRIKRLIDEEIIQIVAVSNPFKLGFEIAGDLDIHVEMNQMDSVLAALKPFRELWYIVIRTGAAHINAEFVVKSLEDLNELVCNRISQIQGVKGVDISVIMKYIKRKYDYGTALDEGPLPAIKPQRNEMKTP